MGSLSIMHWLVVLVVAVLLFGRGGRISRTMGDMGKGIRAFREGLTGKEDAGDEQPDEQKTLSGNKE
jgi:sec-independent protein translocase protein TatA